MENAKLAIFLFKYYRLLFLIGQMTWKRKK